jgi:hypothetical protein
MVATAAAEAPPSRVRRVIVDIVAPLPDMVALPQVASTLDELTWKRNGR